MIVLDARRRFAWITLTVIGASLAIMTAQNAGDIGGFGVLAPIAAAGAVFACIQASMKSTVGRSGWRLIAFGSLVWFLLAVTNTSLSLAHGDRETSSYLHLGSLLFLLFAGVGMARLLLAHRQQLFQREEWIDGLLTTLATMVVGVEFLLLPITNRFVGSVLSDSNLLVLAFQVGAIGLTLLIALALATGAFALGHETLLLLLGSVLVPAGTLAMTGGLTAAFARGHQGIPALGWTTGFTLIIISTWQERKQRVPVPTGSGADVGSYFLRIGGVACVSALLVTAAAVRSTMQPGVDWVVVVAAAGTGILIAARLVHAGTIAERLLQRTHERDRLVNALKLSPDIVGSLDVDRLLPALASTAACAIDQSRAEVTLISPEGRVEKRATFGLSDDDFQTLSAIEPCTANLPQFPTVRRLEELSLTPETAASYRTIGKRNVLVAPLRGQGQVLGFLELWTPGGARRFTAQDLDTVAAIVREGGFAIQNAKLLASTMAAAEERSMLLRVIQAATSSLDVRTVLAEIAQASLGISRTECCTILLLDEETNELEIGADQTIREWPGVQQPGYRFPLERFSSDQEVIASRKPRRYDQTSGELSEYEREHMRQHGTQSMLVVPLIAGEKTLGTLNLLSRRVGAFDENATLLGIEIAGQTALAIQHARLLAETRHYAEEQSVLLRVGKAATSSLELTQVLEEITLASLLIPGAECCGVLLWDREANELEMGFESTIHDLPGGDAPGTRYTLDGFHLQQATLNLGKASSINDDDEQLTAVHKEQLAIWGARSLYMVPLLVGDECLGIFQTYSRQRHAFGASSLRLGHDIAAQTALAVHNARLLAESRRQADELAARLRVSQAVSSSLELEKVLDEVARASLGVAGAECCEIEIMRPELEATEMVAQQQIAEWPISSHSVGRLYPLSEWPMTTRVLSSGQPCLYDDANSTLTEAEQSFLFGNQTRSGLSVPIVVDGQNLGVLSLFSRQPSAFTQHSLVTGQDLASQAALAIERARLHAALRERAQTDALTGVLNRGAIEERLDQELSRARRSGLSMAVLVIDLDGFKQVNDRHGHLIGDRVLQHTADVLKDSVREGDFVGRYGGDEFLLVLPDADDDGAVAAAQRILTAAGLAQIATGGSDTWLSITLSIGLAFYPRDGSDHEEMIAAADRAMYAVKPATAPEVTDFTAVKRSRTSSLNRKTVW